MSTSFPTAKITSLDEIQTRILILRGHRVLLDSDLANFYGVPTHRFNEAIKRNALRFPKDFCFRLTPEELSSNSSQIAMSSSHHRGAAYRPWAFTEHGAVMAATILNSPRAIQMSLVVIRAFVALRRMVLDQQALTDKLKELDARVGAHDKQLSVIIEAIRQLAVPAPEPRRKIGFNPTE
jgi:hypothetical protein